VDRVVALLLEPESEEADAGAYAVVGELKAEVDAEEVGVVLLAVLPAVCS
jgi:hypothetical protein